MRPQDALSLAIEIAGGLTKLGKMIGCTKQRVWNWTAIGLAPVKICPKIEAVTGVRCEELRPDINWDYMRQKLAVGMEESS
jgi:DNA-binding transcriptional regulator YdaS (Cro superfamily)